MKTKSKAPSKKNPKNATKKVAKALYRPPYAKAAVEVDLNKLPADVRERVERALKGRRSKMLSMRFPEGTVELWKSAAVLSNQHLTRWVEECCNERAQEQLDMAAKK